MHYEPTTRVSFVVCPVLSMLCTHTRRKRTLDFSRVISKSGYAGSTGNSERAYQASVPRTPSACGGRRDEWMDAY